MNQYNINMQGGRWEDPRKTLRKTWNKHNDKMKGKNEQKAWAPSSHCFLPRLPWGGAEGPQGFLTTEMFCWGWMIPFLLPCWVWGIESLDLSLERQLVYLLPSCLTLDARLGKTQEDESPKVVELDVSCHFWLV